MISLEFNLAVGWTQFSDYHDALKTLKAEKRVGEIAFMKITEFTINAGDDGTTMSGSIRGQALGHRGVAGEVPVNVKTAVSASQQRQNLIRQSKQISASDPASLQFEEKQEKVIPAETYTRHLIKPIPVTIAVTLIYATTDTDELMGFFRKWAFAAQHQTLTFIQKYLGVEYPVEIVMSRDLTMNDRDEYATSSGYQVYEGTMTCGAWFTNTEDARYSTERPVIKFVDSETEIQEVYDERKR